MTRVLEPPPQDWLQGCQSSTSHLEVKNNVYIMNYAYYFKVTMSLFYEESKINQKESCVAFGRFTKEISTLTVNFCLVHIL